VGVRGGGVAGFGEQQRLAVAAMDGFEFPGEGAGVEVVGEGVVVVESDVVEFAPEADAFELFAVVGGVGDRPLEVGAGGGDEGAELGFVRGGVGEFGADGEQRGLRRLTPSSDSQDRALPKTMRVSPRGVKAKGMRATLSTWYARRRSSMAMAAGES